MKPCSRPYGAGFGLPYGFRYDARYTAGYSTGFRLRSRSRYGLRFRRRHTFGHSARHRSGYVLAYPATYFEIRKALSAKRPEAPRGVLSDELSRALRARVLRFQFPVLSAGIPSTRSLGLLIPLLLAVLAVVLLAGPGTRPRAKTGDGPSEPLRRTRCGTVPVFAVMSPPLGSLRHLRNLRLVPSGLGVLGGLGGCLVREWRRADGGWRTAVSGLVLDFPPGGANLNRHG